MIRSAALIAMLSMAACSAGTGGTTAANNALNNILQFTVADLAAADKETMNPDGTVHDVIGHACYPVLSAFIVSTVGSSPTTTVVGAFSAFQAARNGVRSVQGFVVPDTLKVACAALVMDTEQFLIRLAAIGATAGAVAPIVPIILHPPTIP